MKWVRDNWVFALIMSLLVGVWLALMLSIHRQNVEEEEANLRRQAFYQRNACVPNGYIASRGDPVRTYRCNGGVFIWRDMQ